MTTVEYYKKHPEEIQIAIQSGKLSIVDAVTAINERVSRLERIQKATNVI